MDGDRKKKDRMSFETNMFVKFYYKDDVYIYVCNDDENMIMIFL